MSVQMEEAIMEKRSSKQRNRTDRLGIRNRSGGWVLTRHDAWIVSTKVC